MASQPVSAPAECCAPAAEPDRVEPCLHTAEADINSTAASDKIGFPSKTSKVTDARGKTSTGANRNGVSRGGSTAEQE